MLRISKPSSQISEVKMNNFTLMFSQCNLARGLILLKTCHLCVNYYTRNRERSPSSGCLKGKLHGCEKFLIGMNSTFNVTFYAIFTFMLAVKQTSLPYIQARINLDETVLGQSF